MDYKTIKGIEDKLKLVRPNSSWEVDMGSWGGHYDDAEAPTQNEDGTWNFSVYTSSWEDDDGALTFSELDKMAEVFGTKSIDFTNDQRSSGYCETCFESWDALVVTFKNAVL